MRNHEHVTTMTHDTPEVWILLYDQMPPAMRWILGVLTLGLLTLAAYLLRLYRQRLENLEKAKFMTREEHQTSIGRLEGKIDDGFSKTHERIDRFYERE